jgi:DNA modification methylase
MILETNKIYHMDCLEGLKHLPENSIDCCVTSPPYWGLRDYGVTGQIGLEPTTQEFVAKMVEVFEEVRRVLKKDGTLWLNIGDSYAGGGRAGNNPEYYGKHKMFGKDGWNAGIFGKPQKISGNLKRKDLVGIPWMLAFALRKAGWYLRQDIIWSKPNPMPESVTDRCTKSHEYLFLLTKSAKYYYDADAIRTTSKNYKDDLRRISSQTEGHKSIPDAKINGLREREYCARNPRPGIDNRGGNQASKKGIPKTKIPGGWDTGKGAHGTIHRENRTEAAYSEVELKAGANKRSVWTVPTQPMPEAHFATFPEELITDCIKAGCPIKGTVIDPFMGAGTTALVARKLGRNFIGFELNADYIKIANKRLYKEIGLFL